MPTTNSNEKDEFISIEEVTVSPRGRKKVIDSELANILSKIPAGKAVRLSAKFGEVPADSRPKVSQIIRKHWEHVHGDNSCRINYSPEGIPQVFSKS